MNEKKAIQKSISLAIILLLLTGIILTPTITGNLNKFPYKNELIQITIETNGIDGIKPHSIKLTQHQVNQITDLFETIKKQLNNTKTQEESIEILTNAILKLKEMDILPKSIDIEEIKTFFINKLNENDSDKSDDNCDQQHKQILDDNENQNCLIAGHTRFSLFISISSIPRLILLFLLAQVRFYRFNLMLYFMDRIHNLTNYSFPLLSFIYEKLHINIFMLDLYLSLFLGFALPFLLPTDIAGLITFGYSFYDPWYFYSYFPSKGWVYTNGQNGVIKWNGTFFGHLDQEFYGLYVGVRGYTGIKIWLPLNTYFLGFASKVKLDSDHP